MAVSGHVSSAASMKTQHVSLRLSLQIPPRILNKPSPVVCQPPMQDHNCMYAQCTSRTAVLWDDEVTTKNTKVGR